MIAAVTWDCELFSLGVPFLMDISDWPIEKIMQLPADCFGTRFYVGTFIEIGPAQTRHVFCDPPLPNIAVLHEFQIVVVGEDLTRTHIKIALANKLPKTEAQMSALEPLIPGLGELGPEPRFIQAERDFNISVRNLKQPVMANGRRVVIEVRKTIVQPNSYFFNFVFSALPTSIPDFYAGSPKDDWAELIRLMRIGVKIR